MIKILWLLGVIAAFAAISIASVIFISIVDRVVTYNLEKKEK